MPDEFKVTQNFGSDITVTWNRPSETRTRKNRRCSFPYINFKVRIFAISTGYF